VNDLFQVCGAEMFRPRGLSEARRLGEVVLSISSRLTVPRASVSSPSPTWCSTVASHMTLAKASPVPVNTAAGTKSERLTLTPA